MPIEKKRAGSRTTENDRTRFDKGETYQGPQLEKCRGDPDTKVRAQIMDYKHKNRSTKAKIDNLRSEKTSYIKLFERVSTLVSTLLNRQQSRKNRMLDEM